MAVESAKADADRLKATEAEQEAADRDAELEAEKDAGLAPDVPVPPPLGGLKEQNGKWRRDSNDKTPPVTAGAGTTAHPYA